MKLLPFFALAGCILVLPLVGCNSEGTLVVAKGKLVKGGEVFAVKSKGPVPPGTFHLFMELVGEDGRTEPVAVESDNTSFRTVGAKGKGVKPGKYKLVVAFYDPAPPEDQLKGAFSAEKSSVFITIEAGKDLGTVDLYSPPK